jgi:2-aminoadipate transaminase
MSPRRSRVASRDLERYAALFATRTQVMTSSAMRDLMAITERPEVISLAGGLPDTSTFPPEEFAAIMERVAKQTARALQYGPTEGMAVAKEAVSTVMAAEHTPVDPEDILITTGGQQVIDLVCKALIDPGDVIVAEGPTYPGAIPSFTAYQADVVQIDIDDDGMPTDVLEETLDRLEREGRRPKFIYTIPNFQNPGGVTMSLPRRQRLLQIARERELLVLEDNPYGVLRYEGEALPTIFALERASGSGANEFVIYLGTFSKVLSPGIRLGWAAAPHPVLAKLNMGKQGADLCSSTLSELFVAEYFATGAWDGYVRRLKETYRRRRDTMLDALAEHAPAEATWTRPRGGLFVWATLPSWIDTTDLLARALSRNVAFVPGRAAYVDRPGSATAGARGSSSMRLNFSGVAEDDIREGIRRIGEVINEQVGLYGALTGKRAPAAPPATPTKPAAPPSDAVEPIAVDPALADVLHLPRPGTRPRRAGDAG